MTTARTGAARAGQLILLIGLAHGLLGCGDRIQLPSAERLVEFEMAGPEGPSVDMDRIARARMPIGPYRVTVGDVLQLTMPLRLFPDAPEAGSALAGEATRRCRVGDAGSITLPHGRQIEVVGKSLAEIETAVVDAYYPEFVKVKPLVYAEVLTYNTRQLQVLGGVTRPGLYSLRHDQMSLVALLMEAGGILEEGATVIRIVRNNNPAEQNTELPYRDRSVLRDANQGQEGMRADAVGRRAVLTRAMSTGMSLPVRVWFRPEGPLRTTGWVVLERGGEPLVRQWLDVANGPQKRKVFEAAAARLERLPVTLLNRRFLQLAQTLESDSGDVPVHLAAYAPQSDWQRTSEGDYVTLLGDVLEPQEDVLKAMPPGGESAGTLAVAQEDADTTLVLPVRGLNIPFADVALREGDVVIVERLQVQYISVLGLVRSPGNFAYPVGAHYKLAEALAFAGGLDAIANPRYVTLYRLKADGTIASATFQLVDPRNQEELTAALALPVKPGDVVSVEHTPRTRTNAFLDRYFRVNMGVYLRPEQLWGEE